MRIRSSLTALCLLFMALLAGAQPLQESTAEEGPQASPRAAMFTFLGAMHRVEEGNFEAVATALECLDITQLDGGQNEAHNRAAALWFALDHLRVVQESELPSRAEIGDSSSFTYFPKILSAADREILDSVDLEAERIVLVLGADGRWRFSAQTVEDVLRLRTALSVLENKLEGDGGPQPWLRQWMPGPLVARSFMQIEYWQWAGLLALIFAAFVADQLLRVMLAPFLRRVLRRWHAQAQPETLRETLRPLGMFGAGLVWLLLLHLLGFEGAAETVLLSAGQTFTILAGTWAVWDIVDLLGEIFALKAARTSSTIDDVLVPLARKAIKVFVVAFGVIYAAQSLHFNIVPLITGLGIGGLAFAFAAKDTIENFFGSVAVILDRPFEVGDWVVIGDVEGTVEDLGFRSTRIRTFYNSQITVPNSSLVRATVDNYGRRRYRRWNTTLGVQYDTTPDQILAFTEGIRELIRTHPFTRKDYHQVRCREFGPSSLDILLYVFFEVPEWSTELRERERLMMDILRLADRLGVQFAFPTQTLHVQQQVPVESPEPAYELPGQSSDQRAGMDGVRAAQAVTAGQPWRTSTPEPVKFTTSPKDVDPSDPTQTTEDSGSPRTGS